MPTYTKREPCVLPDGRDGFYVEGHCDDGDPFVGYENANVLTEEKVALAAAEAAVVKGKTITTATKNLPTLLAGAIGGGTVGGLIEALRVLTG